MASAVELDMSGEGDSFGLYDSQATRFYHVTVDNRLDKPTYILRLPGVVGSSAVLFGSRYPTLDPDGRGLYANRFTQVKRIDSLNYIVMVEYGPPGDGNALEWDGNPWHYSQSPGLGTKTITEIIDDNGVHTNIGPHVYVKKTDNEGSYVAYTTNGPVWFDLGSGHAVEPVNVPRPAATFTLSRVIASMTLDAVGAASGYEGYINTNEFYGRPAETVMFSGASISSSTGIAKGQSVQGVIFNVQLLFEYRAEGYRHRVYDRYIDETTGEEFPILTLVGTVYEPVWSEYKLQNDIPFANILSIFNELA